MDADMKGFRSEHEGKRLRIEFSDGEICEGDLVMVCGCEEHASCRGIIFDLWATNQPGKHAKALEKVAHPAIWSEMEFVKNFEVLETGVA